MKSFLFILLCFYSSLVFGDVYEFPDREFHITTAIQVQDYTLQLRDDGSGRDLFYKPNIGSVFIPRVSYKKIWALSWAFAGAPSDEEQRLYGSTSLSSVRLDLALSSWTLNLFYSQYRGLYLENSQEANPFLAAEDPKIQRPDMYSRVAGVSMTWVWDENRFSLPSLYDQSERQERPGGSFVFGGSITENVIRGDNSFIPTLLQDDFDVLNSLRGGRFQTLSAKAGYGYTFAKKWFAGAMILVGPGVTYKTLDYENGEQSKGLEPTGVSEILFSAGYNGDIFFTSLRADAHQDFFILTGSSSQINPQLSSITLNMGLHLDTLNW